MKRDFSPDSFKRWMKEQNEDTPIVKRKGLFGIRVESKIPLEELSSKIDLEDGDLENVLKDFENGGTIVDADGRKIMVEVASGTFIVEKQYLSKM